MVICPQLCAAHTPSPSKYISCSQLPGWKLQSQSPSDGLSYATSSSGWTGQGVVYGTWLPQPEGVSSSFGKLLAQHAEQFHVLPCELNITINYSSLNNLVLSTAGSYRGPRLGSTRWILCRNTLRMWLQSSDFFGGKLRVSESMLL